ncbi:hypothetical protein [Acidovorax sp. SUPP2539]|uniref:hypothetical protein n=1 Tax=Acidovorax sp. SUPP2539 TaxID=2920878 RepID=UPI0023DE4AE9|nr:hypothetical protein [Acidovorax sp. SUPP2539]GKS90186.1 hypothetical protein AVTE2539_12495 [Acidovorax sp. SUPP2539]
MTRSMPRTAVGAACAATLLIVCETGWSQTSAAGAASIRSGASAIATASSAKATVAASETRPVGLWASQPVAPNDTVVVSAANAAPGATVQARRLDDLPLGNPLAGEQSSGGAWVDIVPLQATAQSVKFVPPNQGAGVYEYRILANGTTGPIAQVNAPDVWFVQGDMGAAASPGGRLSVFGTALGGLSSSGNTPVIALVKDDRLVTTLQAEPVEPAEAAFTASFNVPAWVEPGAYRLYFHNGWGGPGAWKRFSGFGAGPDRSQGPAGVDAIQIARRVDWPLAECTVPPPRGNGQPDDKSFTDAFACAAAGGTIALQAGRYTLSSLYAQGFGLRIPNHVRVRGQGMGVTELYFPAATDGPLLAGKGLALSQGGFNYDYGEAVYGVEGLSIIAPLMTQGDAIRFNHMALADSVSTPYVVNVKIDLGDGKPNDANGIFAAKMSNVLVRGNDIRAGYPVQFNGNVFAVTVTDNTFTWYHEALRFNHFAQNAVITNNTFRQMALEAPRGAAERSFAAPSSDVYYARNRSETDRPPSDSVWGLTLDEGNGIFFGHAVAASGTTLTLDGDLRDPNSAPGFSAMVLSGQGAGQMRYVLRALDNRTLVLDRPWTVDPDGTSVISVVSTLGRMLFVNNDYHVNGGQNSFYPSADVVQANNRLGVAGGADSALVQSTGIYEMGRGMIPGWHHQILGNTIRYAGVLEVHGGNPAGVGNDVWYTDRITQTNIVRRNTFVDQAQGSIELWDSIGNSLVEHNVVPALRLQNASAMRDTLLRGNRSGTGEPPSLQWNQSIPADVKVVN